MKVLFDEKGYVKNYAIVGSLADAVELQDVELVNVSLDNFSNEHYAYHMVDGKLTKDEAKLEEIFHNRKLDCLRAARETECFSVINRSTLWYNTLTDEQKTELELWYHAWLEVTETLVVPEKPEWLK